MRARLRQAPMRIALGAAAVVLAIDVATKLAAVHFLQGRAPVSALGGAVHLRLLRNPGGPTGILDRHPEVVSIGTLVAVLAMLACLRLVRTPLAGLALGLVLGAGSGNLLDRLLRAPGPFRGGVVDWLQPPWTSNGVMNFADLMINLGILLGVVALLRAPRTAPAQPASAPSS